METEIAIVGGGLSGLAVADHLTRAGLDWRLFEARDRLGGRVLSLPADHGNGCDRYDLGPAWIWPDNVRINDLVSRFGLCLIPQYAEGRLVFQDEDRRVRRDLDFSPMAGAIRIDGGMAALTDTLSGQLPAGRLHLGHTVRRIGAQGKNLHLTVNCTQGEIVVEARRTILALPPRVVANRIVFAPALDRDLVDTLKRIPTWMAGHAKLVAVYDRSFWRERGLSGSGISHCGPLAEIHDASPATGGAGALFGFIGVPAPLRAANSSMLVSSAIDQLGEMFGEEARSPGSVLLTDWARDPETATDADHDLNGGHPSYGMPTVMTQLFDGRLIFSGTEVALGYGGFLEGALEAAEVACKSLSTETSP